MNAPPNIDVDAALALLAMMERIRAFEEQALVAAAEKLVLGAIHPSIGQEAVAAGLVGALRSDDVLLSTHRGHGHTLAKGADALAMMRELLGRRGGCCGGKGGSMHIADFGVGMLGANGVVGANIVIAAGAAQGLRLKGGDQVVCCIFGDGAINRGPFLEGLNWAAVFELPVLFVCEDNQYSALTRTMDTTGGPGPAARAESLGLRATSVDGNDALALADTTREIIARLRAGGRPEFVHALTYRRTGHTASDPAAYRPAGEADTMALQNDPITRLREHLLLAGCHEHSCNALRDNAQHEMREALQTARDSDWPEESAAFADVQDVGSPAQEAY
ncbi:MAG: thiamine pyrophosphate-dependent dehydrogenase E1 component subunit alpha [Gammaproteobacteria bacterium]|nr:thiamine pyrophosphate-dependent dehydrogenase E1 component subunit alpha [Gammaproteobacteria bacterium]